MRSHIFKSSSLPNLLIADSQARHLVFPNFKILAIPGGNIAEVYSFLPESGRYEKIVLFIGANNLLRGTVPSTVTPEEVALEISHLAETLVPSAKKIYVIGLTPRLNYFNRTAAVNKLLEVDSKTKPWLFRGSAKHNYNLKHLKRDQIHLNSQALSSVKSILKNKILYGNYISEVDESGHLAIINCTGHCTCYCYKSWAFALLDLGYARSSPITWDLDIPKVLFWGLLVFLAFALSCFQRFLLEYHWIWINYDA